MLLRPRRPPPPEPPSPASPDPEPRLAGGAPETPPRRPASPGALAAPTTPAPPGSPASPGSPVSPGSAQRTPWSAHETELLLGTLLQPAVWRALLQDRRQALPTYRRGAPPLPASRELDSDPAWTLRFSPSPPKSADAPHAPGSPTAPSTFTPAPVRPEEPESFRAPGSPPPPSPGPAREDPDSPPARLEDHAPQQPAPPSLNAALLQTLGHLGDIVSILGPLRDQLLTLNQHVEQLRGSFDQTVSLAVGFILGSAAAERGVLADPRP
nr:PREDICTED: undifferentiated embryonic cell transcription factor 1 [Bos indicus]